MSKTKIEDIDKKKLSKEDLEIFEKFEKAAEDVKGLPKPPSTDEKLSLYGLFKQALDGKNTTTRPGLLDFEGKAKYDAWFKHGDMTKQDAQKKYVDLVAELDKKYKPTATTSK
ncbi:hypothetical protein FBU31_000794 [Coemansia sp. 'formosensis']|nr:hypothetical protein FBU31_000794 [Coemansia sp. 'formosensis']